MSHDTHEQAHIVKYRTHFIILIVLLSFTFISIAVTHFNVGNFAIAAALVLASIKSCFVLWHFMHLKYESRLIIGMVAMVLFLFASILILTFIDYNYR